MENYSRTNLPIFVKIYFMKLLTIFFLLFNTQVFAEQTCSRVATINYQEVLVDATSTQKGEGLRFHIEKDPIAKLYLDEYQRKNQITWPNAILGTAGTAMVVSSFLINSNSRSNKDLPLFGGLALIFVNFLVAKTIENENENNLVKAIKEYNKRNLPKIYFNPLQNDGKSTSVELSKSWDF